MQPITTMTGLLDGALNDSVSDKERAERLKALLVHAFSAPDSAYTPLSADEVIARSPSVKGIAKGPRPFAGGGG